MHLEYNCFLTKFLVFLFSPRRNTYSSNAGYAEGQKIFAFFAFASGWNLPSVMIPDDAGSKLEKKKLIKTLFSVLNTFAWKTSTKRGICLKGYSTCFGFSGHCQEFELKRCGKNMLYKTRHDNEENTLLSYKCKWFWQLMLIKPFSNLLLPCLGCVGKTNEESTKRLLAFDFHPGGVGLCY